MSKLPRNVKPTRLIKLLTKLGFKENRKKGSHIIFVHPDGRWTQIAVHPGPIPTGTLKRIVMQAKLTEEDLRKI